MSTQQAYHATVMKQSSWKKNLEQQYRHVFAFFLQKQEFVRPRWPYDMRPSARAEKYMCVIVIR